MNIIDKKIYENLELLPKDLTGWNGESPVFRKLIEETNPSIIIEVGTWKGQSAINMGKVVREKNLKTVIYCVDTWLGAIEFWDKLSDTPGRNLLLKNGYPQIYYQFLSNVVHEDLQSIILPFPNTSENGFRYLSSKSVKSELIYIDASHEEKDVYNDITNYYHLLSDRGVIFGDDYYSWPSVAKSVDRFVRENNFNFEILENNFWVIRK